MPELDFQIAGVEPLKHAASPMLDFRLLIRQRAQPVAIQSVALQCQLRIDTRKRRYRPDEQERLSDLFGETSRWSETLNYMLWTHAAVIVPPFAGQTTAVSLPVPCTFDFNVAATKYFAGLEEGEVPLELLFSGSVFFRDDEGFLSMDLIPWNREARFRLPVSVWQDMMEAYYPNRVWLSVNRQAFDALYEYKRRMGLTGFDEALTALLPETTRAKAS